jgi:hypothetical protein
MTRTTSDLPQEPPVAGTEVDSLLGSLERQRRVFAWKCGGLDAGGMRARLAPSTMTLGGLVKHLALVEDAYFTERLRGAGLPSPWDAVDWDADPDWEWRTAADDTPEELFGLWTTAVERSRSAVADAIAEGGLDVLARWSSPHGETPSLRRILVDLVEEYARHIGHADLIRESVDGLVGEEPTS